MLSICSARHLISSPSLRDSYSASAFPGLDNLLFDIEDLAEDEAAARWEQVEQVKHQLAAVIFSIQSAAS